MPFRAVSVRSKAFDRLRDVSWTFCPCLHVSLTCGTHLGKDKNKNTFSHPSLSHLHMGPEKEKENLSPISRSNLHVGPSKNKEKKKAVSLSPDLAVSLISGELHATASGPVLEPPLGLARHAPPPAHRARSPARRAPPPSPSLSCQGIAKQLSSALTRAHGQQQCRAPIKCLIVRPLSDSSSCAINWIETPHSDGSFLVFPSSGVTPLPLDLLHHCALPPYLGFLSFEISS